MSDVLVVHHARYLLRPTALEIFLSGRTSALLNFPSVQVLDNPPPPSSPVRERRMVLPLVAEVRGALGHR